MRVLVACEFSGVVRDAFVRRGHYAMSCDLLPCESSRPGLHYQGDVRNVLDGWEPVRYTGECDPGGDGWCRLLDIDPSECQCLGPTQDGVEYREVDDVLLGRRLDDDTGLPIGWDLMIGHPECTFLTVANNGPVARGCSLYTAEQAAVYRQDAIDFFMLLANANIPKICIENPVGIMSSRWRRPDQIVQPWHFGDDASKKTCLWLKGLPTLKDNGTRLPGDDKTRRANQTPSGQNKLGPSENRKKLRATTYQGIASAMAEQWG